MGGGNVQERGGTGLKKHLQVSVHGTDISVRVSWLAEYDKNNVEPSFDVTALVEILHPVNVLHPPKPLPGMKFGVHIADVYAHESVNNSDYVEEILRGVKDNQIGMGPSYPYTYHDRLFNSTAFS